MLFGTLMDSADNDEVLSCPHVLAKLEYYLAAIRAGMDPSGSKWQEPPAWEQRLDELRERNDELRERNAA